MVDFVAQQSYNETMRRHRRAALVAIMRHGDIDREHISISELADMIGMPVEDLKLYIANKNYPSYVEGLVARWLSVPIKHWVNTYTKKRVDKAATT